MEEPVSWPLVQTVAPPSWLPDGWTAKRLTRENGVKATSYEDPVSRRRFRSKAEVKYFLETGKSFRSRKSADQQEKLCHKPKEFLETGESSRAQKFVDGVGKFCDKLKLQELGKKLCKQAIHVLRKKDLERNTSQRISMGQSTSMSHGQNGNLSTHSNSVSDPGINSTFHTSPGNPQQGQPENLSTHSNNVSGSGINSTFHISSRNPQQGQPERMRKENRRIKRVQKFYYVDSP